MGELQALPVHPVIKAKLAQSVHQAPKVTQVRLGQRAELAEPAPTERQALRAMVAPPVQLAHMAPLEILGLQDPAGRQGTISSHWTALQVLCSSGTTTCTSLLTIPVGREILSSVTLTLTPAVPIV